jgi:rare lipoprotein A
MKKLFLGLLSLNVVAPAANANAKVAYHETGVASYYHDWFDGKNTANGEIFSQGEMTCAHLYLPFGTKLKITNLKNKKHIEVRVNDRGPYVDGRIIDLSRLAAAKLNMLDEGIACVKIEVIEKFSEPPARNAWMPGFFLANVSTRVASPFGLISKPDLSSTPRLIDSTGDMGQKGTVYLNGIKKPLRTSYLIFMGIFYNRNNMHDLTEWIQNACANVINPFDIIQKSIVLIN